MVEGNKVVAIIPARGGSKSIPRKNLLLINDKPLVAWPILLAKSVSAIDRVLVSTDDKEIQAAAASYGAEVPFLRPRELAEDDTPTLPVLQHCLDYLEEKEKYSSDIVILLYPTSPFLKKERIEEALEYFKDPATNSVVSVTKDYGHFWKKEDDRCTLFFPPERVNRQYAEPLYRENGAIYISRSQVIRGIKKIVDEEHVSLLVMKPEENIDIDEKEDLLMAKKKADEAR